jgi:hypothetical protein
MGNCILNKTRHRHLHHGLKRHSTATLAVRVLQEGRFHYILQSLNAVQRLLRLHNGFLRFQAENRCPRGEPVPHDSYLQTDINLM